MTDVPLTSLSDAELLAETARAVGVERRSTADLLALLAEVDTRQLFLGLGYSSMFTYCMQALHLSEAAAYSRITVARAARDFPIILTLIADGAVTLTTVSRLSAHLSEENHESVLEAARHKSKREVDDLVAQLDPQPDVASSLRKAPDRRFASGDVGAVASLPIEHDLPSASASTGTTTTALVAAPVSRRAVVAPLAVDRYLLKVTVSGEARAKLERARDLLRHQIPSGDPAAIVERALTALVEQLERTKCAATRRPRTKGRTTSMSRPVPAAVKRAVWTRDEGRCAFVGTDGRCRESGFLEFHHVVPFARGGPTSAENLQLRCRAHNAYEAEREFGARSRVRRKRALSGQSSPVDQTMVRFPSS
jgi:5-methylcytosine-specific restriction endonuclease McrA